MGACLSRIFLRNDNSPSCFSTSAENEDQTATTQHPTASASTLKNKPLKRTLHKESVKIEPNWSAEDLEKQRQAFWHTAPAYDGREEIWLALKAAVAAIQAPTPDYEHAQILLDSAGVSLPHGSLEDCYDELGTRYSIPIWVISTPKKFRNSKREAKQTTTFTTENSHSVVAASVVEQKTTTTSNVTRDGESVAAAQLDSHNHNAGSPRASSTENALTSCQKPAAVVAAPACSSSIEATRQECVDKGASTTNLVIRLMAATQASDLELRDCPKSFKIQQCKELLKFHNKEAIGEAKKQVWFCAGRTLQNDSTLKNCKIPEDFIIQVHLR